MNKILAVLLIGSFIMSDLGADSGYRQPPENIRKVFDTSPSPFIYFEPFQPLALEFEYDDVMTLERIAEPNVFLAGEKFSARLNTSLTRYPKTSLTIHRLDENRKIRVSLPDKIRIRDYSISPDHRKLAASVESDQALELVVIDLESGEFISLPGIRINDIFEDGGFWWMQDSRRILIKSVDSSRSDPPPEPALPESPVMEETSGKFSTNRTYQHLLKNTYDKELFDYYFRSQLSIVDTGTGKISRIGEPQIYDLVRLSPDENYLLVEYIIKPYSYEVPHYRFPRRYEIRDIEGNLLHLIHERPLQDEIPIGGTYQGPRRFRWQALKPADLIWVEALDEGNPKIEVDHRDRIMLLEQPFQEQPLEIFRTVDRFSSLVWSEHEDELIYTEYDRDRLWFKTWLYNSADAEKKILFDLSVRDVYNHPGDPVTRKVPGNEEVYIRIADKIFFNNRTGATSKGNFPYLSSFDLESLQHEKLFVCRDLHYETALGFIDGNMTRLAVRSETPQSPRNYFIYDLEKKEYEAVTSYPDPYPEITSLEKELTVYEREDGVPLSGMLYLPPGYQQGDKLPLILHAYPEEYTDASTAGQLRSSPYRFTRFYGSSVKYLALAGYAVLVNTSIPIIGDPETVNDNFLDQLLSSIRAAVDHLDEKGIIDRNRVGIIGHSYGAFMVANVLAHSDICRAGVAKSGAYNRTLTPFGFQSERRTLWQAREFYISVSPYLFADQIEEPLLLIHGENDPNSGTYPMQSRRMYQALKGHGGTARLVVLPYEEHGYRARESNLHVLAEIIEWFDRYLSPAVKGEKD